VLNKKILKILKKIINNADCDWYVQLNLALLAYITRIHMPTVVTPFSLVYGSKAILPIEVKIPSLSVSLKGIINN
jgi:hypothetical protein